MLELLMEALKEMNKQADFVHYTNLEALYKMLKGGSIASRSYVDTVGGKEDEREIAVLRRSIDKGLSYLKKKDEAKYDDKMRGVSENISGVKIYFYSNRILTSLRGVTKNPVSEYNIFYKRQYETEMKSFFKEFRNKQFGFDEEDYISYGLELLREASKTIQVKSSKELFELVKTPNFFIKTVEKFLKKFSLFSEYADLEGDSKNVKLLNAKRREVRDKLARILASGLYSLYPSTVGREGEERFRFKGKIYKIPFDKDYLRIRFYKKFTEEDIEFFSMETAKEFLELLEKYKEIFLVDESYKNLIALIKEEY